jgi:multidrug resistance protein, MATE family
MTDHAQKIRTGHTVSQVISTNASAVAAQILVALSGFMETYFVAYLGLGSLSQFSYVAGFNIIGAALLGGLMQSFLIVGGKNLGEANTPAFGLTFTAASWLAVIATLVTQSAVLLIVSLQTQAGTKVAWLVLAMAPGIVLTSLSLVYRLRALIEQRTGLFLAITVSSFAAKLASFLLFFRYFGATDDAFVQSLGWAMFASGLLSLASAWFLMRKHIAPTLQGNHTEIAERMKLLFAIGIPIGIVIAIELAVLAGAQLMVWHFSASQGALFGVAVQLILLIETIAVATGQVTTLLVAFAFGSKSQALAQTAKTSIGMTIMLHAVIAIAMYFGAAAIAQNIVPRSANLTAEDLTQLTTYIRYGACAQLLLGAVISLAAVLRGLGDVSSPVVLIAINYLGLGLGLGAFLLFATRLGDHGMWIAILASLLMSCLSLGWRVNSKLREESIK